MAQLAAIPAIYLHPIADHLASAGVNVQAWLQLAGVATSVLDDAQATVSAAQLRSLLREGLALSREPALGLLIGARLQGHAHGVLGLAALTSASMRDAIGLMQRYLRLRMPLLTLSTEACGSLLRLKLAPADPLEPSERPSRAGREQGAARAGSAADMDSAHGVTPSVRPAGLASRSLGDIERPLLEATMMSLKNVLDLMSLGARPVREAAFAGPRPEYHALASSLMGCPVRYAQDWTGLAVALADLDRPLKTADPAAYAAAADICRRELDKLSSREGMCAQLRRLLLQQPGGFPSLPVCARLLHLTPRTLHRRLVAEGSSYHQVLDDVRHTLAIEQLRSGRIAIEAIAYGLGYTDTANFRRAFKRWEGVPPSQYRSVLRNE